MSAAGIDDDDFESLLLEHVHAVGSDHNGIGLGVASVERDSGFCRVLKEVTQVSLLCSKT